MPDSGVDEQYSYTYSTVCTQLHALTNLPRKCGHTYYYYSAFYLYVKTPTFGSGILLVYKSVKYEWLKKGMNL